MMTTTTTATKTSKRPASKAVEISVWGLRGVLARPTVSISDADVRVQLLGDDTAVQAFGRRVARECGRGLHLCGARQDHVELRNGKPVAVIYQLEFGYSCKTGGTNVEGGCWIKVYC